MTKKLFLTDKRTKVILYNKETKVLTECQKVNGEWCVKKENGYFEQLQEKDFFRMIVRNGWFRIHSNAKKCYKTVFNVSEAFVFLKQGYSVLDTSTFTSFCLEEDVLKNEMGVPHLPEGTYILYPFQNIIPPKKKEKTHVKSEQERERGLRDEEWLKQKASRRKKQEKPQQPEKERPYKEQIETEQQKSHPLPNSPKDTSGNLKRYIKWGFGALSIIGVVALGSYYISKNQ